MASQGIHIAFVDIAENRQAAHRVPVEGAIAHRQLALVAGGQDEPVLVVGNGHQGRPANPGLDVLLGQAIVFLLAKERSEDSAKRVVERVDLDGSELDAQALGQVRCVGQAVIRGEWARHCDAGHPLGPQGFHGEIRGDR